MMNGETLKERRELAALTQAQLAKLLDLHAVTISNYERGAAVIPVVLELALDKILSERAVWIFLSIE